MRAAPLVLAASLATLVALSAPPAASTHADSSYEQPLWFEWGSRGFPILVYVIPPEHGQLVNGAGLLGGIPAQAANELNPCLNSYTVALRNSIAAWRTAIVQFGAPWLVSGVNFNVYVRGCDPEPPTFPLAPKILVFTDQTKAAILGVAVSTTPCLVDNSKFFLTSVSDEDMYNVNGQEFGHCLGLEHVGEGHPAHDVMDGSYDDPVGAANVHRHCVSNLNVMGLESAFGRSLGQPGGFTASVPVSQYQTIAC